MNSNLNISERGIKFIGGWEGLFRFGGSSRYAPRGTDLKSEDKTKIYVYLDPIGLPTIGYGHLLTTQEKNSGNIIINGVSVPFNKGLTMDQVMDLKKQDLSRFVNSIRRRVKVAITQSMCDALVSFAFNCGIGGFEKSTLLKKLNNKDYEGAANEFLKWTKAGGKVIQGLVNRRKAERQLFLSQLSLIRR